MMCNLRKKEGFTLVELIVSIAVGTLVTVAATTILLLGLRMGGHSRQTVAQQNTARVVMTMLENLASDSSIKKVITTADGWYICSTANALEEGEIAVEDTVIVAFALDPEQKGAIYTGGTVTTTAAGEAALTYTYADGTPILKDVYTSFATLSKENLLTVSVETEEGTYASSTYCRLAPVLSSDNALEDLLGNPDAGDPETDVEEILKDNSTDAARMEFLKVAYSQLDSYGTIMQKVTAADKVMYLNRGDYYAEWYNPTWPWDTPWCACFVVWCLDNQRWEMDGYDVPDEPALLRTPLNRTGDYALAHVDSLAAYLAGAYKDECLEDSSEPAPDGLAPGYYPCKLYRDSNSGIPVVSKIEGYEDVSVSEVIKPGDLIFFDWLADGVQDGDHVGIVLTVKDGYVYTIEGNTADTVAVRKYRENDPRIMGYGVLDWKSNTDMGVTPET